MEKGSVFILSVSSDIGRALALAYLDDGYEVIGTYRRPELVADLRGITLIHCDITSKKSIRLMIETFAAFKSPWDIFISSVGTLEPIGAFFSADFDVWEEAVTVNSLAQLRVLRELWPYRRQGQLCHAAFFAGGGTNNSFPNHSAYAASKIFLIKMCELLDAENTDLNIFILGPGFLPTKIHRFQPTMDFLPSRQEKTAYKDVYGCINWCIAMGKNIAGGRNFSVVHDLWQEDALLVEQLQRDKNKFKLRRFRNKEK